MVGSRQNRGLTYSPEVTRKENKKTSIPLVSTSAALTFENVAPGDDAFLFGYPKSLKLIGDLNGGYYDYDYDKPLLRKGIIAGIDRKLKTIIIDCPVFQGNSGGPVYELNLINGKSGVIGIVTRSVLNVQVSENHYYRQKNLTFENSGYSVVVPIDFAIELMKQK